MGHWTENFTVFDTETTGFRASDRVVEVAFVHFRNYEVVDSFHSLINPQMDIPEEVVQIHGINNEKVRDAPTFDRVAPDIMTWLEDQRGGALIAHNMRFDMRLLGNSFGGQLQLPLRKGACSWDYSKTHHHELSMRKKGHAMRDLVEYFNISVDMRDAHGAMFDAHTLGLIVPKLFEHSDERVLKLLGAW